MDSNAEERTASANGSRNSLPSIFFNPREMREQGTIFFVFTIFAFAVRARFPSRNLSWGQLPGRRTGWRRQPQARFLHRNRQVQIAVEQVALSRNRVFMRCRVQGLRDEAWKPHAAPGRLIDEDHENRYPWLVSFAAPAQWLLTYQGARPIFSWRRACQAHYIWLSRQEDASQAQHVPQPDYRANPPWQTGAIVAPSKAAEKPDWARLWGQKWQPWLLWHLWQCGFCNLLTPKVLEKFDLRPPPQFKINNLRYSPLSSVQ